MYIARLSLICLIAFAVASMLSHAHQCAGEATSDAAAVEEVTLTVTGMT